MFFPDEVTKTHYVAAASHRDSEEPLQGKPSNDARRGRCHLLESVFGPCG
jgi:hypothetical protein